MKKAVYIHGLDGSGSGIPAKNVRRLLGKFFDITSNTYDLLNPDEAFNEILDDTKDADLVIASSLGAFYASCIPINIMKLLINPCWDPCEAIPVIAYDDQMERIKTYNCLEEWENMCYSRETFDNETRGATFAVFSDEDELFSYVKEFKNEFLTHFNNTENYAIIHGTHEAAKNIDSLSEAIFYFQTYLNRVSKNKSQFIEALSLKESRFLNMWFNADEKNDKLINENLDEVWDVIDKSYAYLTNNIRGNGGPGGMKSAEDLRQDCERSNALIKCYKSGGKIQAVAIYNLNRGGRKLSLIGCNTEWNENLGKYVPTSEGKVAINTIMKEDIDMHNRDFWGEVSDGAETSYYFKTKAAAINPEIVKALMPNKVFAAASKRKPSITLRNKQGDVIGQEDNRFDKGYYDRLLLNDFHTKVAITSPENVNKVKDFDKEVFGKKHKTSKK